MVWSIIDKISSLFMHHRQETFGLHDRLYQQPEVTLTCNDC